MEITMNYNQFIDWKYNQKSLTSIHIENKLDKYLGTLDKRMWGYLVLGVATTLVIVDKIYSNSLCVPCTADSDAIDKLGNTFLGIVRKAGYWVTLVMALVEIIKTAMKGGNSTGEIGKIIIKYVLIYASMFLMPWLFDLVKSSF